MKTIDEIREAMFRIHHVAIGESDRSYMSIPANPEHDADLILSAAVDELERLRHRVQFEPKSFDESLMRHEIGELNAELLTLRAELASEKQKREEAEGGARIAVSSMEREIASAKARADEAERRLALIDTGCFNCGGLPHTTDCRVRDVKALLLRADEAEKKLAEAQAMIASHGDEGEVLKILAATNTKPSDLLRQRDEALAACAAMREALEKAEERMLHSDICNGVCCPEDLALFAAVKTALTSNIGKAELERRQKAERDARVDREAYDEDKRIAGAAYERSCARFRERITAAEARVKVLEEALGNLANEATAFLSVHLDPGSTNKAVFRLRIDEARAALSEPPTKGEPPGFLGRVARQIRKAGESTERELAELPAEPPTKEPAPPQGKVVWIPEHPNGGWYRTASPDGHRRGKLGGETRLITASASEALQFATKAECEAWIAANPHPLFVAREHQFFAAPEPTKEGDK